MDKLIEIFKKKQIKTFTRYVGYLFTLLSFYYIYLTLSKVNFRIPEHKQQSFFYLTIAVLTIFHVIFPFISAYSWKLSLEFISKKKIGYREVAEIYVKSNLAKYLPGNVMQYVGRNIIGTKYGWSNSQLAISSVMEVFFMIAAPFVLFSFLYLSKLWQLPPSYSISLKTPETNTIYLAIGIILILSIMIWVYRKKINISESFTSQISRFFSISMLKLFITNIFLSLLALILYGYLFYIEGYFLVGTDIGISNIINVACAISIAGYSSILTPGVPGGIGVKESISVLLLSAYGYNQPDMMLICIISRFFSILGEILSYFIVLLLPYKNNNPSPGSKA